MSVSAVLFDLDDTLVVDEAVSREAFADVAAAAALTGVATVQFLADAKQNARLLWQEGPCHELCQRIGISAFECLWGDFSTAGASWAALREWSLCFRVRVLESALLAQEIESPDLAIDLSNVFAASRRKRQRLMPDALETLTRVRRERSLGMVTNGAPDLQRQKLKDSGLGGFFSAILVSGECDIGKPSPEIFLKALEQIGASPGEAVMVGNSITRDIAGARNAGIRSVWLEVPGAEEPDDCVPDFQISSLAKLPEILDGI